MSVLIPIYTFMGTEQLSKCMAKCGSHISHCYCGKLQIRKGRPLQTSKCRVRSPSPVESLCGQGGWGPRKLPPGGGQAGALAH